MRRVTVGSRGSDLARAMVEEALSSIERPEREVRWTPHKQLLAEVRISESAD